MAGRKIATDVILSAKQPLFRQLLISHQVSTTRLQMISGLAYLSNRQFSVLSEFSNKVKGEVEGNKRFQQSVKELKEKAGELKGVKENLQTKTKQKTEQLYRQVDGAWTGAEATAKKVSANVKEKISAATEEVKGSFRIGRQESSSSANSNSGKFGSDAKDAGKAASGEENKQQSGTNDSAQTLFTKIKSSVSSASPKVFAAFQKMKETRVIDLAKKGIDIVKDELNGSASKNNRLKRAASSSPTVERSTVSDVVVVPKSRWTKKWEAIREKLHRHPLYRRVSGISEPVVTKSHEIVEDMRERWETSDSPVVHKIQDINESVFGETHTALSVKEIKRRDPSFSLSDFVANVQEVLKPVLNAYVKGDLETLKQYCSTGVIERCKAERRAGENQGIVFDNKILHISDVELRETKLMGNTPTIILSFQTQQVYCVRDKNGSVREGGKDTIHTVYYAWAMQPVEEEGGAAFPEWKLIEMQQLGIKTLI